MFPR